MMKSHRKLHLNIWTALAIVLPAGIVIAWFAVPSQPVQRLLQPEATTPLPVVVKKVETQNYTVAIRRSSNGTKLQLEWINKKILEYPTATIYSGNRVTNAGKSTLIGRIEARGKWYFPLDTSFNTITATNRQFILFDFIHQQIIDTINLQP